MNYAVVESQEATALSVAVSDYICAPDWGASKKLDLEYIFHFNGKDKIFTLRYGIPCYFYYENGSLFGECPTFDFISTGKSKKEILKHFDIEFEFIYDEYFLEDDSNLTKDAITLKKLINKLTNN